MRELERAAGRAQARGGLAAAAAFLERAAPLTTRAQRAVAAAQTAYEAGALDDARALLAAAETGPVDDLQRCRVHLLRAQIAFASRRGSDAPPMLLQAARELEAVDPALARATYLEALSAAMFPGRLARGGGVVVSPGSVPDRFFVGLAVLGLLSEVAEERPILGVVDDAKVAGQNLRPDVAFVARRLLAESVVMLFAARDPSDETAGLPELVLGGLRGADARSLLVSVLPGRLD